MALSFITELGLYLMSHENHFHSNTVIERSERKLAKIAHFLCHVLSVSKYNSLQRADRMFIKFYLGELYRMSHYLPNPAVL